MTGKTATDKVKEYYDSFLASEPGKYSSLAEFAARYEPILDFLGKRGKTLRILDVGCGTGAAAEKLKAFGFVCGVDISVESIRQARKRLDEAIVGTAEDIAYPDGSFDTVVCTETLEHVPDPKAAIREFHRVLNTGGHLLLSTPNPWNWLVVLINARAKLRRKDAGTGQIVERYITPPKLIRLVSGNGFAVIDYMTVFFRPACSKWMSPVAGLYQVCIAKTTIKGGINNGH